MELVGLALVVAAGVLIAGAGYLWMRGRRYAVHRRVVVNLLSGNAIAGVVTEARGPYYVIRDATVHEGDQQSPADGEILVERRHVDYVQAL